MRLAASLRTRRARMNERAARDLLHRTHYSARPDRDARTKRQQESAVRFFNRLAHREYLVLVAIVAAALTLHIRQPVIDTDAQSAPASRGVWAHLRAAHSE
jgi:hypothetical protein